jgi:large subunit ribosomal protein L9
MSLKAVATTGADVAIATAATATATGRQRTMPQAILLQDVEALGERGAVVDVSSGYLRNYLQPRKLAEPATEASVRVAQRRQEDADRAAREAVERSRENAATLGRTVLTITQQAGDDGRLFGSVTTQDIADAIREARGIRIDRRKVHLDDPIRNVGTFMVVVEVADEVTATIKTMVVAA